MGCSASRTDGAASCPVTNGDAASGKGCPASGQNGCPAGEKSLFEKLGGAAAVEAAVEIFYKRILADPELAPFFANIDMVRQRKKQADFLTFAFGGSKEYSGKTLAASHRKLIAEQGLRVHHFDLVAGHLVATLKQLEVPQCLVDEVVAKVLPTKAMIFGEEPQQDGGAAGADAQKTLFDRLGGTAAVDAAVEIFYVRILADSELAPFFANIDMARQRRKQADFLTFAFGGSKQYSGKTLAASHRKLIAEQGLQERHFDLVAGHLVATLNQLGVQQSIINEVVAVVLPTKALIFGDGP